VVAPRDERQHIYRKDITEELDETGEVQETGDCLQDGIGIKTNEGLDGLDSPFENVHDVLKKRL